MITRYLYLYLLFFINSGFSQELFCGYEQLHNENSHVEFQTLNLKKHVRDYKIASEGELGDKHKVILNRKYNIIHNFPSLSSKLSSNEIYVDSLEIMNAKFCIQNVLQNSTILNPEIKKIIQINYFKNIYLVIEGSYEEENKINYYKHWVLVFNITDKNNIINIKGSFKPDVFGFSEGYFGDYNNDRSLDFIFINDDKLRLYSIVDEKFVAQDFFVDLTINTTVRLNLLKSKWVSTIEKKCSENYVKQLINKNSPSYIYESDKKW